MQTGTINREQRLALLHLAYSLLPGCRTVIAGGFAASYQQAKDVDLWVLGDPLLERATSQMGLTGVVYKRNTASDSVPLEEVNRTVIACHTPLLPIHIIGVKETSIDDLLDTFDISTHRWAVTRSNVLIAGTGATSVHEDGRVIVQPYPESTVRRVVRLQERYGITIAPFVAESPTKVKTKKKDAA